MDTISCIHIWLTWEEQSDAPNIELSSIPGGLTGVIYTIEEQDNQVVLKPGVGLQAESENAPQ
jgi:hypothetical protein